jgi:hypothetical protein
VRGATLLPYTTANYRAGIPEWARRREGPAPAWWDDGPVAALTGRLPLLARQILADLVGEIP